MKILLTNISPKNANPLLAYPHRGGGGVIPLRAPRISKKAGRHPPLGEGIQATKKRLDPDVSLNSGQSKEVSKGGGAGVTSGLTAWRRASGAVDGRCCGGVLPLLTVYQVSDCF